MRTVRIRVVDLVGDIVDVELDNEVIRHIVVHRRVDSCIAWQRCRVRVVDETVILIRGT